MKRIYLNDDLNPEYYRICEGFNDLMDKWNIINRDILNLKVGKFFLNKTKNEIKKIGIRGIQLQKEYLSWNKEATNFLLEPRYSFERNQDDKELAYLHFTNNLNYLVNSMKDSMSLITSNYNNRASQVNEQRNFTIAITAFIIGIVGLAISIYTTFIKPGINLDVINSKISSSNETFDTQTKKIDTRIDSDFVSDKNIITEVDSTIRMIDE